MAGLLSKPLKFHMDYKVAWICALDIEMAAARLMLDATHDTLPQDSTDDNTYLLGEISGHNIVITCLPAGIYGTISAASVGVQVRTTYPAIRFGLMVGIGGGVPSKQADVRLGDVVVSKPSQTFSGVIQYDIGKSIVDDVFERVGALNSPPNVVLSAVSQLRARYLTGDGCISEIVSAILEMNPGMEQRFSRPKLEDELFQSTYKHSPGSTCANCDREYLAHRPARLSNDPQIHHGLVGSGNRVIKDGSVRDKIADDLGIICFEMEAAGLMNRIPTQVIRGICDYSDSHKNKHWQGYAALTAAAYAKELLTVIPISHASSTRSSSHTQIIAPHALSPLGQSAKKAHLVQIEQRKTMRCYELILGRLSIEISQDLSISATEKTTEKVKITILFPSWISNTLFHINVDKLSATTHPHSAPQLSIRPIYINQNARLRGAIGWCDIKELRTLFSTNQARPTDMIFDYETNEPVTLLEALLRGFIGLIPCASKVSKHRQVLEFLLATAQHPTEQDINTFFFSVNRSEQFHGRKKHIPNFSRSYLQRLLIHGGFSLEQVKLPSQLFLPKGLIDPMYGGEDGYHHLSILSTLVERSLGFESIHACLFHPSQIWTTEDLTMRDIWYIGVQSYADKTFRAALTEYFSGFRSKPLTQSANNLALSVFDEERIVDEVKESHIRERTIFLNTLISNGTPEMLGLFLNVGIDLDECWEWNNYLGTAAAQGKLALVKSMLDAGACGIWAVPLLCQAQRLSEFDFEFMFLKFMEPIRDSQNIPTPVNPSSDDPLLAIIKCSRALRAIPDSIEMLFNRGIFYHPSLYGSQDTCILNSYVFNSILYDRPSALRLFLSHGIPLDSKIDSIFFADSEHFVPVANYTWLTLAIELGRRTCVYTLLQSVGGFWEPGNQNEGQTCAFLFSKALVAGIHPRVPALYDSYYIGKDAPKNPVSFEEDATIYEALQTAFGLVCDDHPITVPVQAQLAVVASKAKSSRSKSDKTRISLNELSYVALTYVSIYAILVGYMVLRFAISLLARGQSFGPKEILSFAALLFLISTYYNFF